MKVIFVCLGNICRSPMAEFICKNYLNNQFSELNIEVNSAGTSGYNDGDYMHPKTAKMLSINNIDNKPFVSKKITLQMVQESDYIFVMDDSNLEDMIDKYSLYKNKIYKITDYSNGEYNYVPDPWYTNNFELTYEILNLSIFNFLKSIQEGK